MKKIATFRNNFSRGHFDSCSTLVKRPVASAKTVPARTAEDTTLGDLDVEIQIEGTIALFHLLADKAREWVEKHISQEGMYFGDALVVEHTYVYDRMNDMYNDGLEIR